MAYSIDKKVKKFLRKEGLLRRFRRNCLRGKPYRTDQEIGGYVIHIERITQGFEWGMSPERAKFWVDINRKAEKEGVYNA